MSTMREGPAVDLRFKIAGRISRPVHEVFEAVADPDQLSQYFTTGGAKGRLVTGATVSWDFADFPGAFPVEVVEVEQDRRIVLRWEAADGAQSTTDEPVAGASYSTTVTMEFEALGEDRTLVTIAEQGGGPPPRVRRPRTATARAGPRCSAA
ncbi:hypothetical protein GCM10029963_17590 [Micromonospora andamanensis]